MDLLINDSNRENNVQKAEINVINFTKNNKNIPLKIKKIVSLGIKNPIGGRAIKNNILNKIEAFYTDWLKHAHEVKVDCFKIAEIHSLIYLQMQKLNKCTTPTNAAKELTTYLDNNKDIIIIQIDKSKDLAILSIEDYSFKLNSIFSPDKFQKLSLNPLQSDLLKYRAVIHKLKPFISLNDHRSLTPYESIKKGFGILKVKKPGMPLRPIVSSLFSMTSGAEIYILKIIKPLLKNCVFSASSTKVFTDKFKKIASKFTKLHEVITIVYRCGFFVYQYKCTKSC